MGVRRTRPSRCRAAACSSWPASLSSRLEAGTAGSRASRAINPSTTTWASRSISGSTLGIGWSGSSLGELVKEPTRYQLLSDARSWDDGPRVERQVRGTDKGSGNVAALPRVYARCLPEHAPPAVASRSLGSAYQARAKDNPPGTSSGWPAGEPACSRPIGPLGGHRRPEELPRTSRVSLERVSSYDPKAA